MSRCGWAFSLLSLGLLSGCAKEPPAAPAGQTVVTPPLAGERKATPAEAETPTTAATTADTAAPQATDTKKSANGKAAADNAKADKTSTAKSTPAAPKGPTTVQLKLDYITDDIVAASVVHPKRLLESPFVAALKAEDALRDEDLKQALEEFRANTGLELGDVEELALLVPKRQIDAMARDAGLPVPGGDEEEPAPPTVDARTNMKMLGLAFHMYHDANKTFPKAGGPARESDEVTDGLSWRVHLLPYLDQVPLYNQFHLDEPWDSEHNKALIEEMPDIFRVDGVDEPGKTSIHVFTSEGAPFANDAAPGVHDFTDGTSNTLLAVVAAPDTAEIWTKPGGLELNTDNPLSALGELPEPTFLALLADGAVRNLPNDIEPVQFANLVTLADGQVLQLPQEGRRKPRSPFLFPDAPPAQMPLVAVKLSKDVDRETILLRLPGAAEATTTGGKAYFAADNWAFAFPAKDLVLFGAEKALAEWLDKSAAESDGAVAAQLRAVDRPFDTVMAVDLSPYADLLQLLMQQNPFAGPFANLRSLTLSGDLSGKPGEPLVALAATSSSPETAQTLGNLLNGMLKGQLQFLVAQIAQNPNGGAQELLRILGPSLEKLEVVTEGSALSLQLPIPEEFDRVPALLAPVMKQQRQVAGDMQKRNNLKQMALAFHNYHDVYQAFPKAGGAGNDNPKTQGALSWRVHLLPFLDQAPLYAQFHLDEAWDSEHNQTLIEQMPEIFKVDGVDEPGKTSIHVFTGPGAPFAEDKAPGIREFTDGTSNTFLAVSAGPDTAEIWTKPGGLDFDPENPLKALGEIGETFLAMFADGSVRVLPETIEPETLLKLLQMADGQPVQLP